MLNSESIKEIVSAVGLRLKFQSAFANLKPTSKTSSETVAIADGVCDVEEKEKVSSGKPATVDSPRTGKLDEGFVKEHWKIFGHKNPAAKLTDWQNAVNGSALQLAMEDNTLLYDRGQLKLRAEEKARQTYVFKQKTGSRSTKLDGQANIKRIKISQEERKGKITELSAEIEVIKKQITKKQNIISKANTVKDYQLCDKTHTELRELLREKGTYEKQLAEFQKKEAKSNWYHKVKGKNESKETSVQKVPLPPQSAVQSMDIRKLFSMQASSAQAVTIKTTETTSLVQTKDEMKASATGTETDTVSSALEETGPSAQNEDAKKNSSALNTGKEAEVVNISSEPVEKESLEGTGPSEQEILKEDSAHNEEIKNMSSDITANKEILDVTYKSGEDQAGSFFGLGVPHLQEVHMREDEERSDSITCIISVLREQEKRDLTDIKHQKVSEGIRASLFEGLGLAEYVMAKKTNCDRYHNNCKRGCPEMVKAGQIVLEEKYVALPTLWRRVFPLVKYDCEKAQRRLLQMPVACVRLKESCFVLEKMTNELYEDKKCEISAKLNSCQVQGYKDTQMENTIAEFSELLNSTPNNGEREDETSNGVIFQHVCTSSN